MSKQREIISEVIDKIRADIKNDVLSKYGLEEFHIGQISFTASDDCPDGYQRVTKDYGRDPRTGKPIIVSKCVKIKF